MKKIVYLILGVLLFIPFLVKADMSAPIIKEYKASVINPNGAVIYEYDEILVATTDKIPYGTLVYVESEEEINDGYVRVNKGDLEENYIIKFKDISILVNNYKVNKKELTDKEVALVLKDVKIRKGPAAGYDSTGVTIKKGTKINIQWFKDEEETNDPKEGRYDSDNPWVYVEYNGTKGFINIEDTIAYREITTEMITNVNAEITDGKNKIGTINVNTVIKDGIYHMDPWNSNYYIKYNGITGYINMFDLVEKQKETEFTTKRKTNIYEEAGMNKYENLKSIGSIPSGEKFTSSFYDTAIDCNIYYEKGNTKGWIYVVPDDAGNCGISWIDDDIEEDEPVNTNVTKKTNSNTLYICLGAAIVISITAVVIVVLINKKKKSYE